MNSSALPVLQNQRLESLDLLRGIALFGILVVNALQYFQPLGLANAPVHFVPGDDAMWPLWGLTHALFDMKFLTVFSFLFGLGFVLQWEKGQRQDPGSFKLTYFRRCLILILFGVVHGAFLYAADVLVVYGVAALILLLFAAREAGQLMRAGVIILLITVSMNDVLETPFESLPILPVLLYWAAFIGIMLLARKASAPAYLVLALTIIVGGSMLHHAGPGHGYATGSDYQLVQEIQRKQAKADENAALDRSQVEIDGEWIPIPPSRELVDRVYDGVAEAPTLAYLSQAAGTYWMATRARIHDFANILLYGLVYFGWRTLGLFLIGAGLMKWGLASPMKRGLWQKATWIGFGVGLPMTVIATVSWGFSYRAENVLTQFGPILHDLSSLLLAVGLAGMALQWGVSGRFGFLKAAFCNVGRMALSNYLGQSLVMSLLAGGYGLGWYGRLTHLELFGLAVLVFAILTAGSTLWLSRFRYGPLEWIWRCGTYWTFLSPFKSKPA